MTGAVSRAGPLPAFVDRAFAGPATVWRGVSLIDGDTFEVARVEPAPWPGGATDARTVLSRGVA